MIQFSRTQVSQDIFLGFSSFYVTKKKLRLNLEMFMCYRLSGFSPFACEDEDETMASVTALDYRFEQKAFASITEEAKSFIKRIIIRIPE